MAFDQATRNRLQKFVSDARALLAEEFTRQLQHEYGLNPATGEVAELSKLTQLDDTKRQTARLLREMLDHYLATSPTSDRRATIERIVREQAFTVLNRLCALRMAEARKLLIESISQGYQSKGFQLYARLAGAALGETGDAYRCFVFSLFDEFAVDLAVLFDRFSPSGRLFPREAALLSLLEQINHPEIEPLWAEDETIGWIYQYFNSKEERKKMRDESAAPRNSRELAVRNQFFTPRYVVEFLTDNTLGRIWYEMTQGQTSLKDSCRYLVRRPNEVFLTEGEQPPAQEESKTALSQDELLQQTVFIPFRPLKDPRDIKMLDPACGSMHFGLYAFDLLEQIYQEAWHLAGVGDRLARDYGWESTPHSIAVPSSVRLRPDATVDCFASGQKMRPEEAVVALLRYEDRSIVGRPVIYHPSQVDSRKQGISLIVPLVEFDYGNAMREHWFAASTGLAFLEIAGCFDFERKNSPTREEAYSDYQRDVPRLIIEHNIHGIDIDPRAVQIAGLSLWLRAQKSWNNQGVKPQARPQIRRSNIVCAEPMPGEVAFLDEFIAQHLSGNPERVFLGSLVRKVFDSMKLAGEAGSLLKIEEEIAEEVAKAKRKWLERPALKQKMMFAPEPKKVQQELDLTRGISDASFWDDAESSLYESLKAYSEQAEQKGEYQRRLFADDAAQGFAFIDLCRKRYDVVLMNPPFGDASKAAVDFLGQFYVAAGNDIGAAFVADAVSRWSPQGRIGVLLSTAPWFKPAFEKWRTSVFFGGASNIQVAAHLSGEVLDGATVNASPFIVDASVQTPATVARLTRSADLETDLGEVLACVQNGLSNDKLFVLPPGEAGFLPNKPFCYWASPSLRHSLAALYPFEGGGGYVRTGLQTSDEGRFCRAWWEIPPEDSNWKPYSKSSPFSPFWDDYTWSERIGDDLREVAAFEKSFLRNVEHFGKAGVTYPSKSVLGFNVRLHPKGCGFAHSACVAFSDTVSPTALLGFLGSRPVEYLISLFIGDLQGKAGVHPNQYEVGTLQRLPWPGLSDKQQTTLAQLGTKCVDAIRTTNQVDEFTRTFVTPATVGIMSLRGAAAQAIKREAAAVAEIAAVRREIDSVVFAAYGFTPKDEAELEAAFTDRIPPASGKWRIYFGEAGADLETSTFASMVISWVLGCALGRWDIRYATGERTAPELPEPFALLPVCPPGQLQNAQSLPARPDDVSATYPVRIPWDGMLVDDSDHPLDIERRVREVIEIIWKDRAEAIEHEACEVLRVKSLRDYFRKPANFFADHLKRYSKSRRQAPIYWPLSTASGSYTLWIYYHRLTDQTLFTAINEFVDPKLKLVSQEANTLRQKSGRSTADEKELEQLTNLEQELKDFRDELLRIAQFWKPNLNDGVVITAAPLWKLFRLAKWQKTLKETWQELEAGDYDWAHLAYSIWPDRVTEKCQTDKSLAIAHGLENLYIEVPKPAKKRASKKKKVEIEEDLEDA